MSHHNNRPRKYTPLGIAAISFLVLLFAILLLTWASAPARAQSTVCVYNEQNGTQKNCIGVQAINSSTPTDAAQVQGNTTNGGTANPNPVLTATRSTAGVVSSVLDIASANNSTTGAGIQSVGVMAYDPGTTFYRRLVVDTNAGLTTSLRPASDSSNAITPTASAGSAALSAKASAGNLYSVSVTTGALAGYLYVFNSSGAVADGAVTAGTASGNYQLCVSVAATTTYMQTFQIPERYSAGIRPVFSTTGCGTLTASGTGVFLRASAQ